MVELLKNYYLTILYHPKKANMVTDALSKNTSSIGSLVAIQVKERPLDRDVQRLTNGLVRLKPFYEGGVLAFIKTHFFLWISFVSGSLRMRSYVSFETRW